MKFYLKKSNNKDATFYNKNGTLTAYSFTCGYVECYESMERVPYHVFIACSPFDTETAECEIKIYKESRVFFVSIQFYGTKGESAVYCFDTLTEARDKVTELKRDYKDF